MLLLIIVFKNFLRIIGQIRTAWGNYKFIKENQLIITWRRMVLQTLKHQPPSFLKLKPTLELSQSNALMKRALNSWARIHRMIGTIQTFYFPSSMGLSAGSSFASCCYFYLPAKNSWFFPIDWLAELADYFGANKPGGVDFVVPAEVHQNYFTFEPKLRFWVANHK